ncbi:enoyl-[acyl-carrier-protein] reductase [Aquitalea magnusonii]|uniref:Nitronate monooxygenase n=1 Tax=Aquitalea magnusonii TaxID=332411 RepID=A0A3G9GKG0_9NEIS|nr:nitronate monooxygenase [Aquitalea magnusonii]BBF86542.1 enoyl-[acyl-carrier-protein] reductase [Aquitalea magnusonii]
MTLAQWLDIPFSIIQAPMAGVQGSRLAIAVSTAGGLGSLPAAMLSATQLHAELQALQVLGGKPYNLNFFCHQMPADDPARLAGWQTVLQPYYQQEGLSAAPSSAAQRLPFNQEMADMVSHYRPAVVSFHFGLPAPALLQQVKAAGCKVLSSATTVAEARWLEANGADAIIAQGLEAGGHRGMFLDMDLDTQLGSFALLPQVVAAVKLPVIAAGGIADAAGIAAAMRLGAAGVQLGTAYLLCDEADTSALHRAALGRPQAAHTALTTLYSGRPARGIVNRLMRELGPRHPAAPAFPLAAAALAPLRAAAEAQGRDDFSPLWCGQNASGCRAVSAAVLTRQLAGQT